MTQDTSQSDNRTPERIRAHYEVEVALADRLRAAGPAERRRLYGEVYDELFRRVPDHPQLARRQLPDERRGDVAGQVHLLRRFLRPGDAFLEVGAGDCLVSLAMTRAGASRAYAIDVSEEIVWRGPAPPGFEVRISDGVSIPVPEGSVQVAYSNQLMEHLHPDDAFDQLLEIRKALAPGGIYVCLTPNRLKGPHDISAAFDDVARGFHLHEYTVAELRELMRRAGFARVRPLVHVGRLSLLPPAAPLVAAERALERAPASARRTLARRLPVRKLLANAVVAVSPDSGRVRTARRSRA